MPIPAACKSSIQEAFCRLWRSSSDRLGRLGRDLSERAPKVPCSARTPASKFFRLCVADRL